MTDEEIRENLCMHAPESPYFNDLHGFDEPDEIPEPRKDCYCDNCFYGRDELALEILKLKGAADNKP